MTLQAVPYALQNASHTAALFRQSASAAFSTGGVLSAPELKVTANGTPNMSVNIAAGRAKVVGTSVSAPAGMPFTTQGMYDVLNDATVNQVIAASNPTNPRIDVVYVQVQDAQYTGSTNTAVFGVVTGTPAASPAVPATPVNALALAQVYVAANVTTVVSGNITDVRSTAQLVGNAKSVADLTALAALTNMKTGDVTQVVEGGALFVYSGSAWVQETPATFASSAARDTAYAKASSVYLVQGQARVYRSDEGMWETYFGLFNATSNKGGRRAAGWYSDLEQNIVGSSSERDNRYPSPMQGDTAFRYDLGYEETYYALYNSSTNPGGRTSAGWYKAPGNVGLVPIVPTSIAKGASGSATVNSNGTVSFTATESVSLNGVFTSAYNNYRLVINTPTSTASTPVLMRVRSSGSDISTGIYYGTQLWSRVTGSTQTNSGSALTNVGLYNISAESNSRFGWIGDIWNPAITSQTSVSGLGMANDATSAYQVISSGFVASTVAYDGISFYTQTGLFTGTVQVFGYNN